MPRPSRYSTNPAPAQDPECYDPDHNTSRVQDYIEALPTFRPGSHNAPPSVAPSSTAPAPQPRVRRTFYHFPDPTALGSPSRGPTSPTTSPFAAREGPLYSAERMTRPPPRRQHTVPQSSSQQRPQLVPPPPPPAPGAMGPRPRFLTQEQSERVRRIEIDMFEGRGTPVPVVRYHLGPRRSQGRSEDDRGGGHEGSEGEEEEEPTAKWVNEQRQFSNSGDYRRR